MTGTETATGTRGVPRDATTRVLLGLRDDVELRPHDGPSEIQIRVGEWVAVVDVGSARVSEVLRALGTRPAGRRELLLELGAGGDLGAAMAGRTALRRLESMGVIEHRLVGEDGVEVAALTGDGTLPVRLAPVPSDATAAGVLSPLAVVTVGRNGPVVQSGLDHQAVRLAPDVLSAVVSGRLVEHPDGPVVAAMLRAARVWDDAEARPSREARQWHAADLWMHRRLHESRSMSRYGGTYPLRGVEPPLAFERPPSGESRALPVPDLDARRREDPPLADVVERRRSVRDFRPDPVSIEDIGELLYRTARARRIARPEDGLDVVDRPYPSGGSVHELELYVLTGPDSPLGPGLRRYAPDRHALDHVDADPAVVTLLTQDLVAATRLERPAPLGLLVSARFGRLMWKYEGMAYGLILKHVGVLNQTLYLNATAMGLGVCALGGASTGPFARATGRSALEEGLVGSLVLGYPDRVPATPWDAP